MMRPLQLSLSLDKAKLIKMSDDDRAGNPYWRRRLSAVNLLILTNLDQLIFILKISFTFFTKQGGQLYKAFPTS